MFIPRRKTTYRIVAARLSVCGASRIRFREMPSERRPPRTEHDVVGDIQIPANVLYGAQAARAAALVQPSGRSLGEHEELVTAIAEIKRAAATANRSLGILDEDLATGIVAAADEVIAGEHRLELIVDVMTGGGGTALHMNMNEVLAQRATELAGQVVHPNTHVNMGQSTNDVVPSAVCLASNALLIQVCHALDDLIDATTATASATREVVKVSRTCLQDAVPMTLGQGFGAHKTAFERLRGQLHQLAEEALSIPLGATAVGTGLGAVDGYQLAAIAEVRANTGLDVRSDADLFDGLANTDLHVRISATLKALALTIAKQAKDIRLMSSGPRAGFSEITIAATQSGSSIMPGKVNPSLAEMMVMVGHRAAGNDLATTMAMADGELDLNVWEPTVIVALFETCGLLIRTIPVYARECVATIEANVQACATMAADSLALAVVVSAMFGYDEGARVARHAAAHDLSIRDATVALGLLSPGDADQLLDPLLLTDPAKSGPLLRRLIRQTRAAS